MGNVTLDDVKDHYRKTHFPENMSFIVAGRMRGRKMKLKKLLSDMPLPKNKPFEGDRFEIPLEVPERFSEPLFIENTTVPNAYFYIDTYKKDELTNSEIYALGLLGTMLTDTLYSKILGEAREKGLIYYLSSSYYRTRGHSSWWFGSQVSEKQLMPFLDIFVHELQNVRVGKIKQSDIESAKMYQIGGHQRSAQTVNSLVNGYSGLYFYNGKVDDYYTKFPEKVKHITKEEMVAVANTMFAENVWGIGFLGSITDLARAKAHDKLSELWS